MLEYQQQIASLEGECRELRSYLQVGDAAPDVGCADGWCRFIHLFLTLTFKMKLKHKNTFT